MDGLKCRIKKDPDDIIQSGWKLEHYVFAVLCFVPDGTITTGFSNIPGCCHNSRIANWGGGIHDKLNRVYDETGLKLVIDSTFSSGTYIFLFKSLQDDLTADEQLLDVADQ